ncbi:MAG TPA: hypothetical protein EYQ38_06160 [Candidatus Pelagibacter sp.]|nr:hypothetical protein [Candidatus Pelagibacter sp.]
MRNIIIKTTYCTILIIALLFTLSRQTYAVTYEEIQENPLSLSLNLKYAKEQENLGNVKNAMVTIERLLLLYPNDIDLNIYYLDLLLDLNSISKASEVVNQLLTNENSNQALLDELGLIAKELGLQKKKPSPFSLTLRTTLSITDVDNVNSISRSKTGFIGNKGPDPLKTSNGQDYIFKDKLYLGKISALASYDLNEQNFFTTEIGFDKQKQDDDINKIYDLKSATVSHVFYKPRYSLSSYFSWSKTDNPGTGSHTADSIGRTGGLSATYNINEQLSANVGVSARLTDYIVDDDHLAVNDNDVRNRNVFIGSSFLLTNTDTIGVNLSYNYQNALINDNARTLHNGMKGISYLLSYNKFLPFYQNLTVNYGKTLNDYMAPDPLIHSEKKRKDIIDDYSIGISGPIPFTNFSYSLSFDYSKSKSRIVNYIVNHEDINFSLRREFSLF